MTEVSPCDNESISTVFLVPKKTGHFRPVINLNLSICEKHSFQDGEYPHVFPLGTAWSLLTLRMLISVHLFSSPIINTYVFFGIPSVKSLLPYLLGTALHPGFSRVFTNIFKPVIAYFRFIDFRVIMSSFLLHALITSVDSNLRS